MTLMRLDELKGQKSDFKTVFVAFEMLDPDTHLQFNSLSSTEIS